MARLLTSVKDVVKNQFWNVVSALAKRDLSYRIINQSPDLSIREISELYENEYKNEIEKTQQLLKLAPEKIKHMYELMLLYQIGVLYAKAEQVSEIMGNDFADTPELDDIYFIQDISAEAIQDSMWHTFATPEIKEQVVKLVDICKDLSLEQLESRLGKLTPNQLAVFKEYIPILYSKGSVPAKEWIEKHPDAWAEFSKLLEAKENERLSEGKPR